MKKIYKYLITIAIGLLIAGWVAFSKDLFAQTEPFKIFHILCDSFFVPAILITGMGALVFVSNEGAFDGLTYAVSSFVNIFRKEKRENLATYYDYKQSKGERNHGFGFMLICGLLFLAVSLIMYLFYNRYV